MFRSTVLLIILSATLSIVLSNSNTNFQEINLARLNETLKNYFNTRVGNLINSCDACQKYANVVQTNLKIFEPILNHIINATEEICKSIIIKPVVKKKIL
jgi:hypothetical protein